jgi:hypothetical protein
MSGGNVRRRSNSFTSVLVLAYFEPDDVPKLIRAIKATRTPPGTRIYVGSYGVNGPVSRQVKALRRGRYAPLFPIKPTSFWNRRRVEGADEPRYAGRLPSLTALLRLRARERVAWGRELGRRFRDEVRSAESEGVGVDAWQFDELVAELRAFWRALAAAAFGLVGEEYPPFSGNPEVVAQAYSAEQRAGSPGDNPSRARRAVRRRDDSRLAPRAASAGT